MTPEFRELVGDEGTAEELERLRRTHELLIAAGPPPELSPDLASPPVPRAATVTVLPRRHRWSAALVAAAVIAASFGIGYLIGNRGNEVPTARLVTMRGVGTTQDAKATLRVGAEDGHGNWPLVLSVDGLRKVAKGSWYELYLTKKGKPAESCGTFNSGAGTTTVRMSVPYELRDYDGWVVTLHRRGLPRSPDRVLLTTQPV